MFNISIWGIQRVAKRFHITSYSKDFQKGFAEGHHIGREEILNLSLEEFKQEKIGYEQLKILETNSGDMTSIDSVSDEDLLTTSRKTIMPDKEDNQ